MGLRIADIVRAAAPGLGCAIIMAAIVMAFDAALPPLPAPARLGVLVPVGGLAFLGAVSLLAGETLKELVALVVRRAPPVQAR
jgi:hypothetical protein